MSKVVKGARFISKISEAPGVEPTIPPNEDHTLGWRETDIYIGEWFWNVADSKIFYRDNAGIGQLVVPDPGTGQIDPSLLPGNYIGAMVYRGVWDASSGQAPGISIGRLTPEKGDYYIVNVSGNTNLDGETDWKVGDYPVYNGSAWDKIDNTEPTIYANNVLYDNTTYTSLNNVDEALEKIFDEKFINPEFDETVTISDSSLTVDKTLLQLNGNSRNKWINWDGTTMKIGSNDSSNSILKVGPQPDSGMAYTSTLDLHWANNSPVEEVLRWKMYSSNTDGYIQGYADDGGSLNTKISAVGDTYFLQGNFGIGTTPSGSYKLQVNGSVGSGDITSSGSIIADSFIYSSDTDLYLGTTGSGTVYLRPSGYASSAEQTTFTTSLATVGTNTQINGTLSVSDSVTFDDTLEVDSIFTLQGDAIINSSVEISGTMHITGATIHIGKTSYNDYTTVTISSFDDIVHRYYVDNEIALHAIGWWSSGTTQTPTVRDVVMYNSLTTYKVGINKLDPTYDLDVTGNAYISSTLDVDGTLNVNGDMTITGNVTTTLNTTGTVNVGQDLTVDGGINLGTDNSDELILRGSYITIANVGGTDNINLMFAGSSAFGDQVIGIQPGNSARSLSLVGQDNTGTGSAGNLIVRGGDAAYVGGDLTLRGGDGDNGDAGDVIIRGGNTLGGTLDDGGDVSITGGQGYTGGDVTIKGGSGLTSSNGNVTIEGGDGGSSSMGEVYIKSAGSSGFRGQIFIDHQINETYAQSINNTTDTPVLISQVVPSMYNFINVDLYGSSYSGGNRILLYLGIIESQANSDFMVTVSGHFSCSHGTLADTIAIRKGSSGTTDILSISSTASTSDFVATLVWNNVRSQWGIVNLAYDGTAPSKPNGNII